MRLTFSCLKLSRPFFIFLKDNSDCALNLFPNFFTLLHKRYLLDKNNSAKNTKIKKRL